MADRSGCSIQHQHPGLFTPLSRTIGDQIRGKIVLVIGEASGHLLLSLIWKLGNQELQIQRDEGGSYNFPAEARRRRGAEEFKRD
jgi:hypothetical protein